MHVQWYLLWQLNYAKVSEFLTKIIMHAPNAIPFTWVGLFGVAEVIAWSSNNIEITLNNKHGL